MSARTVQAPTASDTAVNFRALAQAIHDALVFAGMIQTADTGQINLATVAAPGATHTSMGYEIWRFADALQGSAPIFFKTEYGSSDAAQYPAVWITVGQGSDGAGNLTGKVTSRVELQYHNNGNNLAPLNKDFVVSGDGSRIALACPHEPARTAVNAFFSIERTKDASGADTNEGYLFESYCTDGGSHELWAHAAVIFGVAASQPTRVGAGGDGCDTCVIGTIGSANDGTDVGVFPHSIPGRRGSEQPGMNCLSYWLADFAASSVITVNIYGADHDYKAIGGSVAGDGIQGAAEPGVATSAMLMMRYE